MGSQQRRAGHQEVQQLQRPDGGVRHECPHPGGIGEEIGDQLLGLVAGTGRALAEEVRGDPLDLGGVVGAGQQPVGRMPVSVEPGGADVQQ
ncbi:hypothetical protein ACFYOI_00825 [Streptomyces microflavus]|uniref:hypothetical protein n=1 Tax=Streptomyces microflavus TaxID=1919 RepID=UPI0033BC7F55